MELPPELVTVAASVTSMAFGAWLNHKVRRTLEQPEQEAAARRAAEEKRDADRLAAEKAIAKELSEVKIQLTRIGDQQGQVRGEVNGLAERINKGLSNHAERLDRLTAQVTRLDERDRLRSEGWAPPKVPTP